MVNPLLVNYVIALNYIDNFDKAQLSRYSFLNLHEIGARFRKQ